MTVQIFVLDTETTGLAGAPIDSIVEIGISRVDLDRGKVYPEYSRIVNAPMTEAQYEESWVFNNTDLTPGDCWSSPYYIGQVANELKYLYLWRTFTAYNSEFDFDMFLNHDPWNFTPNLAPCIMHECADRYNQGKWFRAQKAYDLLCPDNPARVPDGKEEHRALSDAVLEGYILLALCEQNPEIMDKYISAVEGEVHEL